jgi:tripartite-type tricarboxylate transporter receptor subunit TctC
MRSNRRSLSIALLFAALLATSLAAYSQTTPSTPSTPPAQAALPAPLPAPFPAHSVILMVPFTPGGAADIAARVVSQQMSAQVGQPIVIENRPGAGTILAAIGTASAKPDGYTLMFATSSTQAVNASLYKHLPYDAANGLVPVALIDTVPFVLVVNPALPVHSVADLVALAKAQPGALNFGSGGEGSAHFLLMELFNSMTGTRMTHVPYKGTAPALNDVLAGNIPLMFCDIAAALPFIKAGKLRALGVSTATRAAAAPDIAPLAEVGLPGFDASAWHMVVAPANTPATALAALNREFNQAVKSPLVQQRLVALGLTPLGSGTPSELQAYLKSETVRWSRVVSDSGIAGSE